ncbi:hypothetical protein Tco_0758281 [Tanacetum coccineum]
MNFENALEKKKELIQFKHMNYKNALEWKNLRMEEAIQFKLMNYENALEWKYLRMIERSRIFDSNEFCEIKLSDGKIGRNSRLDISVFGLSRNTRPALVPLKLDLYGFAAVLAVLITRASQRRQHDTLVRLPMDIRLKIDLGKSVRSHKSPSLMLALEGFPSSF